MKTYYKIIIIVALVCIMIYISLMATAKNNYYLQSANSKQTNSELDYKINLDEQRDYRLDNYNYLQKKNIDLLIIGDQIADSYGIGDIKNRWADVFQKEMQTQLKIKTQIKYITSFEKSFFSVWVDYILQVERYEQTPDIVVISVGKNFNGSSENKFAVLYENILRRILKKNANTYIICVAQHGVGSDEYYKSLEKISAAYKVAFVNMKKEFDNSKTQNLQYVNNVETLSDDGNKLYAKAVRKAFDEHLTKVNKLRYYLPDYMSESIFDFEDLNFSNSLAVPENIKEKVELYGKRCYVAWAPGQYLQGSFDGSLLGLSVIKSPDSGFIKVYIDEVFIKEVDLYNPFPNNENILIKSNLTKETHNFRLEVSSTANTFATGKSANIFGFISKRNKPL